MQQLSGCFAQGQGNKQVELTKISVPVHRLKPLKNVWLQNEDGDKEKGIYNLVHGKMKIDIRMNLNTRNIELTTRSNTPGGATHLHKCADFVHAFMLGFDCKDAEALLKMDEQLYVVSFEIIGTKMLKGIRTVCGGGGAEKSAIENFTKTRIVHADTKLHILGDYSGIKLARDTLSRRILKPPAVKAYSKL